MCSRRDLAAGALALALSVCANARVSAQTWHGPLDDLPEDAGAAGWVDLASMRSHPLFEPLVSAQLRRVGATDRAIRLANALLAHTTEVRGSFVRGSGDRAVLATLAVHGSYARNEVPEAILELLPPFLRGMWYPTTFDGKRAFDIGVALLVELGPDDWLLARRIDGQLPFPPVPPSQGLVDELSRVRTHGTPTAFGVLVGPPAVIPGESPPTSVEGVFRGPARGHVTLALGNGAEVRWKVDLHHRSDAERWQQHYQAQVQGFASWLGIAADEVAGTVTLEGTSLDVHVRLTPVALDAYVTRLIGPRLLSTGSPAPPPAAPEDQGPSP